MEQEVHVSCTVTTARAILPPKGHLNHKAHDLQRSMPVQASKEDYWAGTTKEDSRDPTMMT